MTKGSDLARGIRATLAEFQAACAGIGAASADKAPAGRWTPREIVSHLAGGEGVGYLPMLRKFLDSDVPRIDIVPEQTNMTPARAAMPFAELVALAAREFEAVATLAEGLSDAQLARTAHIPLFKDHPLTEYPSLAAIAGGLGQYHLNMHVEHLREVLAELAK